MKRFNGFTLAEVLITLAIIGVVAAISIPSVVANTQQKEFQTGLRKAVSVLNSAITMSMALDGETPYDNANTFGYLMKHMGILKSYDRLYRAYHINNGYGTIGNAVFYTTDGMRFEFSIENASTVRLPLYENPNVLTCALSQVGQDLSDSNYKCGGCGSYGLNNNENDTKKPPCIITVDVNGDRKPNPVNVNCKNATCGGKNRYKLSDPSGIKLSDVFSVMITDKQAIPYGAAAQRAMYQAQKSK